MSLVCTIENKYVDKFMAILLLGGYTRWKGEQ